MDGRGVAVVQADAVEHARRFFRVGAHVLPQVGRVFRLVAVPESVEISFHSSVVMRLLKKGFPKCICSVLVQSFGYFDTLG